MAFITSNLDGQLHSTSLIWQTGNDILSSLVFVGVSVSWSGCTVTMNEGVSQRVSRSSSKTRTVERAFKTAYTVPLASLAQSGTLATTFDFHQSYRKTADEISSDDGPLWAVKISSKSGTKSISVKKESDGKEMSLTISEVYILVPKKELVPRIQKALIHAMTVCGAKDDPF